MSVYKLYGTGNTDNLANLDIVKGGRITGIQWGVEADLDVDLETARGELSFSSASGFTTNDTKSSISTVRAIASDTGTAASNKLIAINFFVGPLSIAVVEGERLYLHGAGTTITASVTIYVDDGIGSGRPAGRRVRL